MELGDLDQSPCLLPSQFMKADRNSRSCEEEDDGQVDGINLHVLDRLSM